MFGLPRRPTHPILAVLRRIADDVAHGLRHLHDLRETLMATAADLNDRIDRLTTAVDAAKQRIAEDFQSLRDQLANGVSGPDLDAAVARLDESIGALDAVDPDPANPTPAPEV